jgi:hypothetical protein
MDICVYFVNKVETCDARIYICVFINDVIEQLIMMICFQSTLCIIEHNIFFSLSLSFWSITYMIKKVFFLGVNLFITISQRQRLAFSIPRAAIKSLSISIWYSCLCSNIFTFYIIICLYWVWNRKIDNIEKYQSSNTILFSDKKNKHFD